MRINTRVCIEMLNRFATQSPIEGRKAAKKPQEMCKSAQIGGRSFRNVRLMEQSDKPDQAATRQRLAEEAEQEDLRLYSLWVRLARPLLGKDDDRGPRDSTMRKPTRD